jgi:hypothetical protein
MSTRSSPQPPCLASWLLDLFTPYDQADSIPGDLHEEFSAFASKQGPRAARRWYWRQSSKSIAHLFAAAFRTSAWPISGSVIAGFFLLGFVPSLPERLQFAVLHLIRNHVTPYHADWYAYVFWVNIFILVEQLLLCLVIGSFVAFVSKGKELVATITLCLLEILIVAVQLSSARFVAPYSHPALLEMLQFMVEYPIMMLLGGWIVRDVRLAKSRSCSQA